MMHAQSQLSSGSTVVQKNDIFGCPFSKLHKNEELSGNGVKFYRRSSEDQHLGNIETPADDRGFLIGVSQSHGHRRRIFHEHYASSHDFSEKSVYLRNLADDYRADLSGPFNILMLELSRNFINELMIESGRFRDASLTCFMGNEDAVLTSLMRAVQPALQKSAEASLLFLDQLGIAIGTHLIDQYSSAKKICPERRGPLLSRAHLALAKEKIRGNLDGNVSIAEIARVCGLSRGYFISAFKETTGETPHRWITSQRVERARELLLRSELSLADVALTCGFADQSHFTRVFSRIVGAAPGTWRRSTRL